MWKDNNVCCNIKIHSLNILVTCHFLILSEIIVRYFVYLFAILCAWMSRFVAHVQSFGFSVLSAWLSFESCTLRVLHFWETCSKFPKELVNNLEGFILKFCGFCNMSPIPAQSLTNGIHFRCDMNIDKLISTPLPLPAMVDFTPSEVTSLFNESKVFSPKCYSGWWSSGDANNPNGHKPLRLNIRG